MSSAGQIDLNWIRRRLTERKDKLTSQLGKLDRDRRHTETPLEKDFSEQAVQRENDEVLDRLDDKSRQELTEIQRALARLETGQYGKCIQCGESIGVLRLNALPHASHCVECAQVHNET